MKNNDFTPKKLGGILNSTFKVYFKKFLSNFVVALVFMVIAAILMTPYFISVFSLDVGVGYPFYDYSQGNMIAFILGLTLMSLAAYIILPSLLTGYFAPKTIDVLMLKQRDEKERRTILVKSFGRVALAKLSQLSLILIPIVIFAGLSAYYFADIGLTDMIYEISNIVIIFLIYMAFMFIVFIYVLLTVFTNQIAFFEDKKGFKAVFASIKLMAKGNFWVTLGHYLVFALILSAAMYSVTIPLVVVISFALIPSSLMIAGGGMTVLSIILIVLAACFMLCVSAIYYGLYEVFICHLYFNARTRTEDIAFPGDDGEDKKEELKK
jgi:hypothetical protein